MPIDPGKHKNNDFLYYHGKPDRTEKRVEIILMNYSTSMGRNFHLLFFALNQKQLRLKNNSTLVHALLNAISYHLHLYELFGT